MARNKREKQRRIIDAPTNSPFPKGGMKGGLADVKHLCSYFKNFLNTYPPDISTFRLDITIFLPIRCPLKRIGRAEQGKRRDTGCSCDVHDTGVIRYKKIELTHDCRYCPYRSSANQGKPTPNVPEQRIHRLVIYRASRNDSRGRELFT